MGDHMVACGMSGKGKSKFLESCLYQDIAAERGCGLIDPHSLLADDLLRLLITRNVLDNTAIRNRLIYVDPEDVELGFRGYIAETIRYGYEPSPVTPATSHSAQHTDVVCSTITGVELPNGSSQF
jgi:hypothetical protein